MTRRTFMAAAGVAASGTLVSAAPKSKMGVATTCYMTAWRPKDTLEFIDHCNALGAGGVQTQLTSLEPDYLKKVRAKVEQYGMYIEVMCPLPRQDTAQFEAVLKGAKEVGALCARSACLSGRRYETFENFDAWKKFIVDSRAAVKKAVPLAEQHQVKFALENHKDWTADEFVALLKEYNGAVGVCLDTGNNIALLDEPMELVEALLPYTVSTHIKDMGVEAYEDGFLLSEVPLGDGFLDLPKIIARVKEKQPGCRFTLEMITRDPLKVPCLTDKYWATFPYRNGRHLARTLALVRKNPPKKPLPRMTGKSAEEQRKFEDDNVKLCLQYSAEKLGV